MHTARLRQPPPRSPSTATACRGRGDAARVHRRLRCSGRRPTAEGTRARLQDIAVRPIATRTHAVVMRPLAGRLTQHSPASLAAVGRVTCVLGLEVLDADICMDHNNNRSQAATIVSASGPSPCLQLAVPQPAPPRTGCARRWAAFLRLVCETQLIIVRPII